MKKLAIVNTSFPDPEHNYIWAWINELSGRGFWVDIYTEKINFYTRNSKYFQNPQLWSRIHTFANPLRPMEVSLQCLSKSLLALFHPSRIAKMISRLVKQERKKITALRKSVEYLPWISEKYDLVHIIYPRIAVRRMELGEIIHSKTIVSFRGQDLAQFPGTFNSIFERANHIHFISNNLYQSACQQGYTKKNYSIIPPMVDTNFFTPSARSEDLSTNKRRYIIFTSAKLRWLKGFEFAIKAIDILIKRGWEIDYFIAGDGEYREQVLYTIRDLCLEDSVHLLGWIDIEKSKDWMQKADIYLLCSVQEGFNNSVLQAQACGLPCVVTDANGLPENIEDGVTGLLAARRDPWDIASKIETLLNDSKLRECMGKQGRVRAVNQFDLSVITSRFVNLYDSMISGNE